MSAATTEASETSPSLPAKDDSRQSSCNTTENNSEKGIALSRHSSIASVSFRQPQNPELPQGRARRTDAQRLRLSSPKPVRFRHHVSFDSLPAGEATKNNASSLTLNVRHRGYHPKRRSRTFMVGVDENAYSDYALVWLLDNLVDDGDEVVCVRVFENLPRMSEKAYQAEARKVLLAIQEKNQLNKAISIVLEYAVGKLHDTFQMLIQMYQPSMLIVGTKGRSLGFQGLVNARSSFSKYCLQYSPVPVVVVRPDEQRQRKKDKRNNDPNRQNYLQILAANAGKHEADNEESSVYELERTLSSDEEAHRVAAAIGLPAAFDPTIKAYNPSSHGSSRRRDLDAPPSAPIAGMSGAKNRRKASPPPPARTEDNESDEDGSGDEDEEAEFDVTPGQVAIALKEEAEDRKGRQRKAAEDKQDREKKQRLHQMEVNEAAALLKAKQNTIEDEEDEETQEEGVDGSKC